MNYSCFRLLERRETLSPPFDRCFKQAIDTDRSASGYDRFWSMMPLSIPINRDHCSVIRLDPPKPEALSSAHLNQTLHLKVSSSHLGNFTPAAARLMPYRDVGAASQSMDSRQPKAGRRLEAVHNSFSADRRKTDSLAISGVDGDETHVTSPPRDGGGGGGWRAKEGASRLLLFARPRWN